MREREGEKDKERKKERESELIKKKIITLTNYKLYRV